MTYENGRATVRGIVSVSNAINALDNCQTTPASYEAHFADVFAHRDFILNTIRTTDYRLAGTTRVRWRAGLTRWPFSTEGARGEMHLGCSNPYGTMSGPLDVRGTELGANCEPGQTQAVMCLIADGSNATRLIKGFSMKTTCAPHPSTVETLPFSGTLAAFYGIMPTHPDSSLGLCLREFSCIIGPAKTETWHLQPITVAP